jgi:hypothetical protein
MGDCIQCLHKLLKLALTCSIRTVGFSIEALNEKKGNIATRIREEQLLDELRRDWRRKSVRRRHQAMTFRKMKAKPGTWRADSEKCNGPEISVPVTTELLGRRKTCE